MEPMVQMGYTELMAFLRRKLKSLKNKTSRREIKTGIKMKEKIRNPKLDRQKQSLSNKRLKKPKKSKTLLLK